jgi:hypothetical protein
VVLVELDFLCVHTVVVVVDWVAWDRPLTVVVGVDLDACPVETFLCHLPIVLCSDSRIIKCLTDYHMSDSRLSVIDQLFLVEQSDYYLFVRLQAMI